MPADTGGRRPESDRPNVLLVVADQFRAEALENEQVRTPTFDALADRGARFRRAYTTDPACGPARGSLVTGLYPHAHRVIDNNHRLPGWATTVADRLGAAGYHTGYVGKWHLDGDPSPGFVRPGRRGGFEFWEGFNRDHSHHRGHPRFTEDGEFYWEEGYQPVVQTDIALEFLADHGGEDPFFLTLAWGPPHGPYEAPAEYSAMYDPGSLDLRPNVPEAMDTPELREDLAEYYAMITSLDDQMERLLDTVDDREDETVVVFTSDHGDMLGSLGRTRKYVPHEESVHVPLLVDVPGAPAVDADAVVSLVDVAPTLCDLGGAAPLDAHGRSLGPLLRAEASATDLLGDRPGVYMEGMLPYDEAWRALRTDRHTVAVDRGLDVRYLYDTEEDPYQQTNRAGDPEYAETEAALRDALLAAVHEYDDRRATSVDRVSDAVDDPLVPRGDVFDGDV